MSRANLRTGMIIFTVITALVHLFLGVNGLRKGEFELLNILWTLNGLGYLGLLAAFLGYVPFFKGKQVEYVLMAFALITIVAWVFMGTLTDKVAWVTKADEVLLLITTFMHTRAA